MKKLFVAALVIACSPAPAPVAASPSAEPSSGSIPPIDARCTSDADCGTTLLDLSGRNQCCSVCGTSTAGNKTWLARVDASCKTILESEHRSCAVRACATGYLRATCDQGTCKVVTH